MYLSIVYFNRPLDCVTVEEVVVVVVMRSTMGSGFLNNLEKRTLQC